MYEGALSTLNNKAKEFIVGLVIAKFNESLSHFSDLEKNNVGQRVVPSPAKNMPPKTNPTKNVVKHPKVEPAPRDRGPFDKTQYPQTNEGGLNKYARSEKDKRTAEAVDNLDIALKTRFTIDSKETTEIMGVKIEAAKLIWILINEDLDKELAKVIAAMFDSIKQADSTIQTLCKGLIDDKTEMFNRQATVITGIYDILLSSFVDNHDDLGELLLDKNVENLRDDIDKVLNGSPTILTDTILTVIEQIAACSPNEALDVPSFINSPTNIDHFDTVIKELTIGNLELPKRTPLNKKDIVDAIYRKCQVQAIKNMARVTSNNTKTIKNYGEFIVEQAHFNQDKMLTTAKRVLILKDLDKLDIYFKNKIKSKQIESARSETEKFLLSQGIKKEEIVKIHSFSERFSSIRIDFRDEYERNGADLKIRRNFNTHKFRTVRHLNDSYPGEIRPDLKAIKDVLRNKYNSVVDEEFKIDNETWVEFVHLAIINAGYRTGKKNYIEFTDPTCPNYNVLVYNYEVDDGKENPFFGFEWNEVIPNPKLRKHFDNDLDKVAFYAFKIYGLHTCRTHTKTTWKKVESDWLNSGVEPPQPTPRRAGSTRRNNK